jgi:predicted  nucleic acid-binding Zn-ribbon protein
MTNLDRIENLKWNIQECESKIMDLNRQRGKFDIYTHNNGEVETFESSYEYDKYIIDSQIRDLEREIQSDLSRIASLEREMEANAY